MTTVVLLDTRVQIKYTGSNHIHSLISRQLLCGKSGVVKMKNVQMTIVSI